MQIDRLNTNINATNHVKVSHKKAAKPSVTTDIDKKISESAILDIVTKSPVNTDKVNRAKELLESGELLSFENILSTTKNIIKSGF